jgi:hypothetical protein
MKKLALLALVGSAAAAPPNAVEEVALKAREAAAVVVPVQIDWPAAEAARAADGGAILPESLQKQADALRLPVLLPASLAGSARLVAGPTWYAATLPTDGAQVVLHAFGHTHVRPELLAEQKAAGYGSGEPRVSRVHALLQVALERFGLAFTLDVECASPETDPRCSDPAWALGLVDDLVVVGGRP